MRFFLAFLAFLSLGRLAAQTDLTTPLLTETWQATLYNPALLSQRPGLVIGLPGVFNDAYIENLTYNDLIREEGGRNVLDVDRAIDKLEPTNQIRDEFRLQTVGVGWSNGKLGLSLSHQLRYTATLVYPRELPELIWNGNAQFIGQTVNIAPRTDVLGYHQIGLGLSYKFAEVFSIGGRVNYLGGISAVQTERDRLELTTDDETYALTLGGDYLVNSSGALRYDGLDNVGFDLEFAKITGENIFGQNTGLSLDLGAALDLGRLHLQASALDLGGIDWEEDVRNYTIDSDRNFTGLDIVREIFDDSLSFNNILDTLAEDYEPTETGNSFRTTLPARYYLSGQFDLTDRVTVGALFFYEDIEDVSDPGIALSGRLRISDGLILGAIYGLRHGEFTNFGLNANLGLGPVRLLLATDNIITAFRPKDSNQANVRIGLSLDFRKKEAADE
ncbi:MAG: DUF5723 family protein [Saprospiraceae bacterium]